MYVKLLSLYTLCEYDIVISYKTVKLQNLFYNYVFTSHLHIIRRVLLDW